MGKTAKIKFTNRIVAAILAVFLVIGQFPLSIASAAPISNLAATPGSLQAAFTFTAPDGASSVILQQSTDGGGIWNTSTTGALDEFSTSAVATALINGQLYSFRLNVTGGGALRELPMRLLQLLRLLT